MEFGRLREVEDFEFGELPDDDENDEVEEIDAINDETFGAELGTTGADLGEYAAQTASLRLEDWEQPGCSNEAAPDASQVPLPVFPFGFNNEPSLFAPTLTSLDKLPSMWDPSSNGLFNMWGNTPTSTTKRNEYDRLKESFDAMDPFIDAQSATTSALKFDNAQPTSAWDQPRRSLAPGPPAIPVGAQTLDQIERAMMPPPKVPTQQPIRILQRPKEDEKMTVPKVPALPVGALSAEELERGFIKQDTRKATDTTRKNEPPQNFNHLAKALAQIQEPPKMPSPGGPRPNEKMPPSPFQQRGPFPMPPGMMGRPPMPPPLPPMLMPFVPVWVELLSGKIPYLPPNVPPIPPAFVIFFRQMRAMGPPPRPPMMGPPMGMGFPGSMPPPNVGSPMSDMRKVSNRRVAPGMPSGKTIEDFAFEPFAGFMSCKEREWLVKIQILQCQGSGDSYDDDFYYMRWRDKQLANGWRPSQRKEEQLTEREERGRRYRERKDSERQSANGTPRDREDRREDKDREKKESRLPFFAGSLGKPVSSTVYNPRHLIDVKKEENMEEEKKSAAQAAASQKKLRTMLLRLEAAASHLITCAEKRRLAQTLPTYEREAIESEIGALLQLIFRELFSSEHLTKTLQLSKGRTLYRKFIETSPPNVRELLIASLFDAIPTYSKRIYNDLTLDLCPIVDKFLASQDIREQLLSLINRIDAATVQQAINDRNTFARDLLCTLLLWCSRRKVASNHDLFIWLRSKATINWDGQGWTHLLDTWSAALHLRSTDLENLKNWLCYLSLDPKAVTVATSLGDAISKL